MRVIFEVDRYLYSKSVLLAILRHFALNFNTQKLRGSRDPGHVPFFKILRVMFDIIVYIAKHKRPLNNLVCDFLAAPAAVPIYCYDAIVMLPGAARYATVSNLPWPQTELPSLPKIPISFGMSYTQK